MNAQGMLREVFYIVILEVVMFKAGFSRVDVTPPLGSYVAGYFFPRYAKGVLDPIELNAAAFSDGERTVLVIVADFIGVDKGHCDKIRKKISDRVGVPAEHILLTSLHQHTSVCIANKIPQTKDDFYYMESVYRKYCDVAQMAMNDMSDAVLSYGEEETAEPIAFIRRYVMKDGTIATNPDGRTSEIVRPCNDADNTVRLLRLTREGMGINLIRRLTPLECERLQGFPDGWTNIPSASDSARYKALGNSVAIPCVEFVMKGVATYLKYENAKRRRRQGYWIAAEFLMAA